MNVGSFMYQISYYLMSFGKKLYDVFTYKVNIKWITSILDFFKIEHGLPGDISLFYILTGASALLIITIIAYNIFKL